MKARRKQQEGPMPGGPNRREEAVLDAGGVRLESAVWDFSLDGGAVGTILFGRNLPAGAVVTEVYTDELTAVTGATSITLKAGSTALTGATDLTADAGIHKRALAGAADGIKLSATSELQIAIATLAATAGRVRFYVKYMLPNDGQP